MEYLEDLPLHCPLGIAKDEALNAVYRVVTHPNPTIYDFLSNAALNLRKPEAVDECRWASCSLFRSKEKASNIAHKLAKTRINNPHLSLCNIALGSGKSISGSKAHIDFWPFRSFDPAVVVLKTEKVL